MLSHFMHFVFRNVKLQKHKTRNEWTNERTNERTKSSKKESNYLLLYNTKRNWNKCHCYYWAAKRISVHSFRNFIHIKKNTYNCISISLGPCNFFYLCVLHDDRVANKLWRFYFSVHVLIKKYKNWSQFFFTKLVCLFLKRFGTIFITLSLSSFYLTWNLE